MSIKNETLSSDLLLAAKVYPLSPEPQKWLSKLFLRHHILYLWHIYFSHRTYSYLLTDKVSWLVNAIRTGKLRGFQWC